MKKAKSIAPSTIAAGPGKSKPGKGLADTFLKGEELFRIMADALPQVVWTASPKGVADFFNTRWYSYTGLDGLSTHDVHWNDWIHPEDRDGAVDAWKQSVETGEPIDIEYRLKNKSGEYRWHIGRGLPIRDEDQRIVKWIGTCTDIHAERQAEQLRNSLRDERTAQQKMITALLANIPGVVWESSGDPASENFKMLFVSDYIEDLLGIPSEEFLRTHKPFRWIAPEESVRLRAHLSHIFHAEGVGVCRYCISLGDGTSLWVESHVSTIHDPSGAPIGMRGIDFDITAQKHLEEAYHQSASQLRLVIDAAPALIAYLDRDHIFRFNNENYRTWLGVEPEELVGKHFRTTLGEESYAVARPHIEQALIGTRTEYESLLKTVDGQERYVRASYIPDVAQDASVRGLVTFVTDLSDHRRIEEALRTSEERFRSLADAMPQIVWSANNEGVVDYYNKKWYEYTGFRNEDPMGPEAELDVVYPEDLPGCMARWKESTERSIPFEQEYRLRRADGQYRWHLGRALPIREETTNTVRWYGTNTDIHDHKTTLNELQLAKSLADAANSAKDHFLATLSHELRTPLTPVLTTVETLETDEHLPEEFRTSVETIRRNVELEARLIDDLLDITRITTGKVHLIKRTVDLHQLIANVVEICRRDISNKKIELQLSLHASNRHIYADSARMQQVLWNLLQNAVKFTPPEGHIRIRTFKHSDDHIGIEISDNGIGIDAEHLPNIFKPFEQGERSITKRFGGLGLGLAISKMIVDMHQGSLEAKSEGKGRGAKFIASLTTVMAETTAPSDSKHTPAASISLKNRILLVDDHEDTNRAVRTLLSRRGYDVQTASSIKTAMEQASVFPFDLLISDIGLPDGSGWELIRKIKDLRPVVAIALSGYCTQEDIERSKNAGFDIHLTKPFSFVELEAKISSLLVAQKAEGK